MILFFCVFIALAVINLFMWISLARQGDERRKFILTKTCAETFLIYTFTLLIDIFANLFFKNSFVSTSSNSSVIPLGVISVIFTIIFIINKKKFGG